MSLLQRFLGAKCALNICRTPAAFMHTKIGSDVSSGQEKKVIDENMPVEMENPYLREKPKCILCKYNIEPNYKNVRLLSQFVSSFTGRVYGRHITGLCEHKHKRVTKEIMKARISGLMGCYNKNSKYLLDPQLYDESNPLRPHKYI